MKLETALKKAAGLTMQALCDPKLNSRDAAKLERALSLLVMEEPSAVRSPGDLYRLFADLADEEVETFQCITLNAAHEVIARHELTRGLVNQSLVHPREAFRKAILDNAVAIAFAHNHPGGSPTPSAQDIQATRRLVEAGELIGIRVLDHVVISRNGCQSCRKEASNA